MILIGLAVWAVWGVFLCVFYGQRVVLRAGPLSMASFAILCGPLVWLAMFLVWLWDLWRNR